MKKHWILIALLALILPVAARGLWFYRGVPPRRPAVQTPDYQALKPAQMPLQTSETKTEVKRSPGVVAVDFTHGNLYQSQEIQSLREALEKRGGKVEFLFDPSLLALKLKYARAFVVVSPSSGFTDEEIKLVADFVSRGGRLLVFADATRGVVYNDFFSGNIVNYADSNAVNPLLAPHGIVVNNDYLYNVENNDGNFRNVFFENFDKDEAAFGLKRVALYGTRSLKAPQGKILLRPDASTLSSIDDAHHPDEGGAALSADGNVLAFGDFTFLSAPYFNAADNGTLIANIADFALGGKRQVALQDFPFVFKSERVRLYPATNAEMQIPLPVEFFSAFGELQTTLGAAGYSLQMSEELPAEGDMIIVGLFEGSETIARLVKPFDVSLPMEGEEKIFVPQFGQVGRYGNVLILLDKTPKGNRLILLADSPEDLMALFDKAVGGSLEGCALQGDIAVCGVGYGSDYSTDGSSSGEAPPEGEATPAGETAQQGNG